MLSEKLGTEPQRCNLPEAQTESPIDLYVPTTDTVIAQAYRRAGLLNVAQSPSTVQGSTARQLLMDLIDKLSAEGVFQRQVQPGNVSLILGQNTYPMAEAVIDIIGNGSYIDPTQSQVPFQAASETLVVMKDRDFWQQLTSKAAASRPTIAYFARNAPLGTLYIWPTPSQSEVGGYIRFQFQKERPDLSTGNVTLPFERYWSSYFVWALAAILAFDNSLPLDRVSALQTEAAANLLRCKAYSKQNVSTQVQMNHYTGWSNRRRW